jgi:hypothetical protein
VIIALVALVLRDPQQASAAACSATLEPTYSGSYTCVDLGTITGVPEPFGGLTVFPSDHNKLIIGGDANTANGALYEVTVVRDAGGHITGFSGSASFFADAVDNDGGVVYGPGGVLFLARWPANQIGETKPGSTTTDKIIDAGAIGVAANTSDSALNFVPSGFPGAGKLKIVTWPTGTWYTANYAPDGSGTYDITAATNTGGIVVPGGPEGFTYVPPGSPVFPANSMLLSEYSDGNIVAYTLDGNGDPVVASRSVVLSGLSGAEGAAIDPVTGDFLFSTFGEAVDHVVAIHGFSVPPTATETAASSATSTATPTASSTPTATRTPCIVDDVPCTPVPQSGIVRTATPRATATSRTSTPLATQTAPRATPTPVTTVLAVEATPRTGVVQAPNTGSGPGGDHRRAVVLVVSLALAMLGVGAIEAGRSRSKPHR